MSAPWRALGPAMQRKGPVCDDGTLSNRMNIAFTRRCALPMPPDLVSPSPSACDFGPVFGSALTLPDRTRELNRADRRRLTQSEFDDLYDRVVTALRVKRPRDFFLAASFDDPPVILVPLGSLRFEWGLYISLSSSLSCASVARGFDCRSTIKSTFDCDKHPRSCMEWT